MAQSSSSRPPLQHPLYSLYPTPRPKTYIIIGASRGIGLALTAYLLQSSPLNRVIATARAAMGASHLWALTGTANGANLEILECDVACEESVARFVAQVAGLCGVATVEGVGNQESVGLHGAGRLAKGVKGWGVLEIDVCVVNAGVLVYPNRMTEISYKDFSHHLTTNTIGPLLVAQALLNLGSALPIHTLAFMSSDSGSAARFRPFEDGFAAYAASKAALNQGLRHLAAEIHRRSQDDSKAPSSATKTVVLALHPGEVATDIADASLDWEIEGIITPEESVRGLVKVIREKGRGGVDEAGGEPPGTATFWTWEGKRYPW